jgi:hypothetical protein
VDFFVDLTKLISVFIIPAILIELYIFFTGISRVNWGEQVLRVSLFDLGSYFLLLTAHLSERKYRYNIVLLYTLLLILLLAQFGRRTSFIELVLFLLAMIIIRLRSPILTRNDRFVMYFVGLIVIIATLYYGNQASSSFVFQRGFSKEAFNASRGTVFEGFFLDFNSTTDFIFGRGLTGTVLRSDLTGMEADYIENGFLILLLKGGLLYLISFVLLLLRAIYLGLFKSNNDIVKALAFFLIIYLIIMYGYNLPLFSTKYIIMWISVAACFNPELRNVSNEEFYQKINSR